MVDDVPSGDDARREGSPPSLDAGHRDDRRLELAPARAEDGVAPVPGAREVDHREEERGGKAPYRDLSAAALNFDGEGAELRKGGEVEHLGRPRDPGAAVHGSPP